MNRKYSLIVALILTASPSFAQTSAYLKQKAELENCSGDDCRILAESIIEQRRNSLEHGLAILRLLTNESLPKLRALVRESPDSDFHWGAVAALAHLGDSEIVADLQIRQERFKEDGDDLSVGRINHYLWMIDVQKSAESLLGYVAAKPEVRVEERLWAIQRANDIGIPKADIRKAILDHAAKVTTDKNGIRQGLNSVKQVAVPLGILTEDDLPGVNYHRDLSDVVSE